MIIEIILYKVYVIAWWAGSILSMIVRHILGTICHQLAGVVVTIVFQVAVSSSHSLDGVHSWDYAMVFQCFPALFPPNLAILFTPTSLLFLYSALFVVRRFLVLGRNPLA